MSELLRSPWIMGYYGWLIYNVGLALYQQKKFDVDGDGYGFSELMQFLKYNNVSLLFTLLLVPVLESQAENILFIYNYLMETTYPFNQIYYYFVGVLAIFIQMLIHKLSKLGN